MKRNYRHFIFAYLVLLLYNAPVLEAFQEAIPINVSISSETQEAKKSYTWEYKNAGEIKRTITNSQTCSPEISLEVQPGETVNSYGVEEILSVGVAPSNINENGIWDTKSNTIQWGVFRDNNQRILTYTISGIDSEVHFYGKAGFDGIIENTSGNETVIIDCLRSQVANPVFEPDKGELPLDVSISCPTPESVIYYSIDGTKPDSSSLLYTSPLNLTMQTTLRAIAIRSGMIESNVVSTRYDNPLVSKADIIQVSSIEYGCFTLINLGITPNKTVKSYGVTHQILPSGAMPTNINEDGIWDKIDNSIHWGTFRDNEPRSLTYELRGINGLYLVKGTVSFDGIEEKIDENETEIKTDVDCEQKPYLSVVPEYYSASANSGTVSFSIVNIESDVLNWSAKANNDWLSIEGNDSGIGNKVLTVYYSANTGNSRVGTITISAPDASNSPKIINIYQAENNESDNDLPIITGLSSDTIPTKSKTWNWSANESCTFRFSIDQNNSWDPTGEFGSITTATKADSDGKWYLHVQAKDQAGKLSDIRTSFAILDNTPPDIPKDPISYTHDIETCSRNNIIKIAWQSSDDKVVGYSVLWDKNPETIPCQSLNLTETEATSLPLSDFSSYYAHVRAMDTAGNWSNTALHFGPFCIDSKDTIPKPEGLKAFSKASRTITLIWNEIFLQDIKSYNIYRSDTENGSYIRINPFPVYELTNQDGWQQIYIDKNLINEITYWYKISSVTKNNMESSLSTGESATPKTQMGGDFQIFCFENYQAVNVGDTATFEILVESEDNFAEKITLFATSEDLPPQVIREFGTKTLYPSAITKLDLKVPYSIDPGDYTIKLVANSENRSHEFFLYLKTVKPGDNEAFIYIMPVSNQFQLNDIVGIFGQLFPLQPANTDVSISVLLPEQNQWQKYTAKTDETGFYHFNYTPETLGKHTIKASWVGNNRIPSVESESQFFIIGKGVSKLLCSTTTQEIEPGSTVEVLVQLRPALSGVPFQLEIFKPDGNVVTIKGLKTQTDGRRIFTDILDKDLPGAWKFKASWTGNEHYLGAISVPMVLYPGIESGEALIIAGGGIPNNTLWETTEYLANKFYTIVKSKRFTHDQIMYISDHTGHYDPDGDGIYDIIVDDHSPSVLDVQNFIEDLHAQPENHKVNSSKPLIIYMMDHGGQEQFKVNKGEILKASEMDKWLDSLQAATNCEVILIIEACYSGTFIAQLTPTQDQKRILISSSNTELSNYDQEGSLSFSQWLFNNIFQGDDLKRSFYKANYNLSKYYLFSNQTPQLIDGNSGEYASQFYIGGTGLVGNTMPEILSATPNQFIHSGNFSIFAQVDDLEGLEKVWVTVMPPNLNLLQSVNEFETPLLNLESIELIDFESNSIFEGEYHFQCNGTYNLTFFARDLSDNVVSHEVRVSVDKGDDCVREGDINNDRRVDLLDLVLGLRIVSGIGAECDFVGGDLNGDGVVGLREVVFILQKIGR